MLSMLAKCKKLKEKVFPKVYKSAVKGYESNTENMRHSVAVYYSNGVMGKVKYRSVYRASAYSFSTDRKKAVHMSVANCPIPRLFPYHRLVAYIKSVDAGKLYSVRGQGWIQQCFFRGVPGESSGEGARPQGGGSGASP